MPAKYSTVSANLVALAVAVAAAACSDKKFTGAGGTGGDSGGFTTAETTGTGPFASVSVRDGVVKVGSETRTFRFAFPTERAPGRKYPLILAFHGDGGTGAGLRADYPIDAIAGPEAIVAYPDGNNATWDLYTPTAENRDIAFVEALISGFESHYGADRSRVFGAGLSSGGFFINQVSCRRGGIFRGIASSSGGAPHELPETNPDKFENGFVKCPGLKPTPTLAIHGTNDTVVVIGSGEYTAAYWAYVNGCAKTRRPVDPSPCVAHDSCPPDLPVVFCPIQDLGHELWQKTPELTWQFFQTLF